MGGASPDGRAAPHAHGDRGHAHSHSVHGHGDAGHSHTSSAAGSSALRLAVVLTLGFAVVELIGGWWSGSLALLADAGHMVTDSAALLFAYAANVIARRPVSDRHSFGLARVEVVAAFVNSIAMLLVVGWIFYEAIDRIRAPVTVGGPKVIAIATVGLIVNLIVVRMLYGGRDNLNTRAAFLHVIGDLLGSVAAIVAGVVITLGGPVETDPLLSMFVAALILRSTLGVLRETTLVLLDSVPPGVDYDRVGRALAALPGIRSVHDLHIWSMVPGREALSAHVLVEDIERWPVILHQARRLLKKDYGIDHVTLQPEWLRPEGAEARIRVVAQK